MFGGVYFDQYASNFDENSLLEGCSFFDELYFSDM